MILITDTHIKGTIQGNEEFFSMLELFSQTEHDIVFLGDIFDLWLGIPEYEKPIHHKFIKWCLEEQNKRKIIFLEGNHEFYVFDKYSHLFHNKDKDFWIDEKKEIFFTHGDLINKEDNNYLILRKITKNNICRLFLKILPFGKNLVNYLKRKLTKPDKTHKKTLPAEQIDEFIERKSRSGFKYIFTGHFHLKSTIKHKNGITFFSLPDWEETKEITVFDIQSKNITNQHWQQLQKR